MSEKITLILVDDHPIVRQGVRLYLDTQPDIQVLAEAGSGEEGIRLAERHTPDLIILDILMPGLGGIETARSLKRANPLLKIIALTSSEDEQHILAMVRAGASAYVLKDVEPRLLVEVIRKVAQGEVVIEPRIAALMVRSMQDESKPTGAKVSADLTDREIEVLRLVANGFTNIEIANRLFLSDKTIKTHVSNILAKLQLSDRTQAAVFAWRQGLLDD